MNATTPRDDDVAAVLREALASYPWHRFTPELLARFALAARDRHQLAAALTELQGAAVGVWERLEPADRCDVRLARFVGLLADLRGAGLRATCRNLAGALGAEPG